jgi:hypothetical protein
LAAAEPTLLKCQAKDYAGLNDHGLLDKRNLDFWLTTENFIVDLSTGAVRTQGLSKAVVWSIIQTGDSRNDWVLTPDAFWEPGIVDWPPGIAEDFIRIRTWSNSGEHSPITFFRTALTHVFTGTCVPVE